MNREMNINILSTYWLTVLIVSRNMNMERSGSVVVTFEIHIVSRIVLISVSTVSSSTEDET